MSMQSKKLQYSVPRINEVVTTDLLWEFVFSVEMPYEILMQHLTLCNHTQVPVWLSNGLEG